MESSPPSSLVPRLEDGVGNSVVNKLTATTLDVCFDEVGVAVLTIAVVAAAVLERWQLQCWTCPAFDVIT